jgi:hypothetical protein
MVHKLNFDGAKKCKLRGLDLSSHGLNQDFLSGHFKNWHFDTLKSQHGLCPKI